MVEVTLALGLVTFCLLALVGLLPIGLQTVRTSKDEAAAINCMEQISNSIREALPQASPSVDYHAFGAYQTLVWSLGGSDVSVMLHNLSSSGFPTQSAPEQRYAARILIHPPANAFATGTASISVAWPAQATWNETLSEWQNAQGAVYTWFIFLPRPRT